MVAYMVYTCYKCKQEVDINLTEALPGVKCPHCGQRILYKARPPIIKRLKAE